MSVSALILAYAEQWAPRLGLEDLNARLPQRPLNRYLTFETNPFFFRAHNCVAAHVCPRGQIFLAQFRCDARSGEDMRRYSVDHLATEPATDRDCQIGVFNCYLM